MSRFSMVTGRSVLAFLMAAFVAIPSWAQEKEGEEAAKEPPAREGAASEARRSTIKPYDKVITKEAKTKSGLFMVHQLDNKVFYEIPPAELGTDMLWVTQLAETQAGFGQAGAPVRDRVVRWELRDETVLLRDIKYTIRAEGDDSIKDAVERTSLAPIIRSYPVAAWGKDKAPVIDVTALFKSDVAEFSARRTLDAGGLDEKRTFVDTIKAFPKNVETKVLATYTLSDREPTAAAGGPRRGGARGPRRDPSQGGVTVLLHHSMVKLPETPMKPRRHDDRVGFINVEFEDYGLNDDRHQVEEIRYITRWRLEKKDPNAEVSEPVKPIVFYVGRGVPEKWKPWVKKGIEMWQPAFEAAGFKNAIIGKIAPTEREDPDWDAEDARISTIQWLPSTTENAFGPHVHDPRSGEILEADVRMYHNVIKLVRDWYFVQASPNDKRAQKLPLPDDLIGELLAYVVAHEVGHSIGFPHNMKASSSYTVEQLRDAEFTKKFGTEASIMDYGRFNYVAQPGDGAALIPVVGPYDLFAVEWGYRQFKKDANEKAELAKIVKRQVDDPKLRFGDPNPDVDPSQQTEDLGSDPIAATEMGLKNINRVAGYLVEATCKEGEDYDLLQNMHGRLLGQRARELGHVVSVVGGVNRTNLRYGDAKTIYTPVVAAEQRRAVKFLTENAFQVPSAVIDPSIMLRLEAAGVADRILTSQRSVVNSLINDGRIKRMAEQAQRNGYQDDYAPAEMLADVRKGIWNELDKPPVKIDLYRRNLQRAHVEHLAALVGTVNAASDLPALARGELAALAKQIAAAKSDDTDAATKAHLTDVNARIEQTLDPRGKPKAE
ncbi:MAG: zinc-dependent metalloprotease [Pirellulales bacterium]